MVFPEAHIHEIQKKEKVVRVVEKKEKIVLPKLERREAQIKVNRIETGLPDLAPLPDKQEKVHV
jgi:hypothetical protein